MAANRFRKILPFILVFSLAACRAVKVKLSSHYVSKAEKLYSSPNPGRKDLIRTLEYLGKALELDPGSARALPLMDDAVSYAYRRGYSGILEKEGEVLAGFLSKNPLKWKAWIMLVSNYGLRGHTEGLKKIDSGIQKIKNGLKDENDLLSADMLQSFCDSTLLSWIYSQGGLSISKDPDITVEKTLEYEKYAEKFNSASSRALKALKKQGRTNLRESELYRLFTISVEDIKGEDSDFYRMLAAASRMRSDPRFKKAVINSVEGNLALLAKDFPAARSKFESVLANQPGFIYASKALAEVDFQQGAIMGMSPGAKNEASNLLIRAYKILDSAGDPQSADFMMPFVKPGKFASSFHALKASVIKALASVQKPSGRKRTLMEREFRSELKEAVKLDSENTLAKTLLNEYAQNGF